MIWLKRECFKTGLLSHHYKLQRALYLRSRQHSYKLNILQQIPPALSSKQGGAATVLGSTLVFLECFIYLFKNAELKWYFVLLSLLNEAYLRPYYKYSQKLYQVWIATGFKLFQDQIFVLRTMFHIKNLFRHLFLNIGLKKDWVSAGSGPQIICWRLIHLQREVVFTPLAFHQEICLWYSLCLNLLLKLSF